MWGYVVLICCALVAWSCADEAEPEIRSSPSGSTAEATLYGDYDDGVDFYECNGFVAHQPHAPVYIGMIGSGGWMESKDSLKVIAGIALSPDEPRPPEDIVDVHAISDINLVGYGHMTLVEGMAIEGVQTAIPGDFCLLLSRENSEAFAVELAHVRTIRRRADDTAVFIGGMEYTNRRNGLFEYFGVDDGLLQSKFFTDMNMGGHSDGWTSDGCFNYKGGELTLSNYDADGDGFLDIVLSGLKRIYCTPQNFYDSDKVMQLERVKILYLYRENLGPSATPYIRYKSWRRIYTRLP